MKDLQFGFPATTTGGDYVNDKIQPNKAPREYSTLGAATKALANGQIDAFLMDVAIGSSDHQGAAPTRSRCRAGSRPAGVRRRVREGQPAARGT